jgi:hypothetical protein
MIDRRSKMVSFRLSWEEYKALQQACSTAGVRSLSELARAAVQHIITGSLDGISLHDQVRELRDQVSQLSLDMERMSQRMDQREEALALHAQIGGRI